MEKLIRKLRRELARNPKKSALLGGATLLAIYFWAPLVAKWVQPVERAKAASSSALPAPEKAPAAQGRTTILARQNGSPSPFDWRELARRIEEDPLHTLADLGEPARDPFFLSPEHTAPQAARQESQMQAAQNTAPTALANLGFKLEGVLLSGRLRAAIINGTLYRENERMDLSTPADAAPDAGRQAPPVLTAVHADYVVIRREGETLCLEVERSTLAPGDRIAPVVRREEF